MNSIEQLLQDRPIQAALASFHQELSQIIEQVISVQQIPAPTFAEGERAAYVRARFLDLGLLDVQQDEVGNVFGRYPGTAGGPPVVLSAHLDTVFPAATDLTIRRQDPLLYGPGMADNSNGVAGLMQIAQTLARYDLRPPADLWFVADVGEEGLGNLRGMRAVVRRFGRAAAYLVVEGGLYGQIFHRAIGVHRYRIAVTTPGGHSWGSFGNPSAIHLLGRLIAAIDDLSVPHEPKTTYNVGVIEGGTSVNTIAQSASLLLDLRSESPDELVHLVGRVEDVAFRPPRPEGVNITMELIGDRPAGELPRDHSLVQLAESALRAVGCHDVQFMAGSTDANVPLSLGYPAVCIGLATSANAHRLDEYLDTTHLPQGLGQLLLLTLAAAGYP